ncbi:DUF4810 domain-containing protein [Marinimicrobium sp. C2-29]|uniref:DUF4810 domain-containing protein n=1 Tax=Marinimicrobium sp. C2-29 TaxID=3139825 RepID=UPI0031395D71
MIRSVKRISAIFLLGILTTGCATNNNLHNWGNYENNLFNYYDRPELQEAIVASQIEFLRELENSGKRPAPGLFAEAGTFLLLEGDRKGAIEFYQKEHDAWPESRPMMSVLINNLKDEQS